MNDKQILHVLQKRFPDFTFKIVNDILYSEPKNVDIQYSSIPSMENVIFPNNKLTVEELLIKNKTLENTVKSLTTALESLDSQLKQEVIHE